MSVDTCEVLLGHEGNFITICKKHGFILRFWLSDPHNSLLSGLRRESFLIGPQSVASKSNCYPRSAKLHRVCVEREASPTLHPEEPDPVQVVGLRNVASLRVHRLRRHHAQHALPGYEVLSTAQGKIPPDVPLFGSCIKNHDKKAEGRRCSNVSVVHNVPRFPQHHLHRFLHAGVCPQVWSF